MSSKNSSGANCIEDDATPLATLSCFREKENTNSERSGNRSHEFDEVAHIQQTLTGEKWSPLRIATRMNSAGEFARELFHKIDGIKECPDCRTTFFSKPGSENHKFLEERNLEVNQDIAADDYFEIFTKSVPIIEKWLPKVAWTSNLRICLIAYLTSRNVHFEWIKCNKHRGIICGKFNECIAVHCILKWCIHINNILSGRTTVTRNEFEKRARNHYLSSLKKKVGVDNKLVLYFQLNKAIF